MLVIGVGLWLLGAGGDPDPAELPLGRPALRGERGELLGCEQMGSTLMGPLQK